MKHFEDLWNDCEEYNKQTQSTSDEIIQQLIAQIGLYKSLSENDSLSEDNKKNAKLITFGEILLTLSNLSLLENINSYEAMGLALKIRDTKKLINL